MKILACIIGSDDQGRVKNHYGPPPNSSSGENGDMNKIGVLGEFCATDPDDNGNEHDNAAARATKTIGVWADRPGAEKLQINCAILVADSEIKGFGYFKSRSRDKTSARASIFCTAVLWYVKYCFRYVQIINFFD